MATGSGSTQRIPYDMWVEDVVDHYRLKASDLLRFLRKKFGRYDERYFNIQVGVATCQLHDAWV